MGIRMPREDRAEVMAMVPFSEMLERVHITVLQLAADSQPNATAAWGLVFAMRPLRGNGLTCVVHAVNACTMLRFRLILLNILGVGRC